MEVILKSDIAPGETISVVASLVRLDGGEIFPASSDDLMANQYLVSADSAVTVKYWVAPGAAGVGSLVTCMA